MQRFSMMFGKKKVIVEQLPVENPPIETIDAYDKPLICLFDADDNVKATLQASKFQFEVATTGACVKVPNNRTNDEHFLHLNFDAPANLHEFDVVIFDMSNENLIEYNNEAFDKKRTKGKQIHALLSRYPQKIFDPRPLSIHVISKEIEELLKKPSILIQFCSKEEMIHYQLVEINNYDYDITGEYSYSNLDFYSEYPSRNLKSGKKLKLPEKETKLSPLLGKYISKSKYEMTFYHPTKWNGGKNDKIDSFIPLLENENGEIVSFCHFVEKGIVFVFPLIEDKSSFLSELLNIYLPEISPELFPFHGQFGWLDTGEYLLPNEQELTSRKNDLEEQYLKDIQEIESQLYKNKTEFSFLHQLLFQTGDTLVKSVEYYMRWLGFKTVINMDEEQPEIREEDLQIETEKGLLVIEVKGIGGTSTDKDCSQISKIRFRRAEQRNRFDVSGLYIVNHQRYMPPKNRNNPPFTANQLTDAVLDKRGLLTTYDLYKAYFLIEAGILSKETVRNRLFDTGLVDLGPHDLVSIGTPAEFFNNNTVVILNINNSYIFKDMDLIAKKNNEFQKLKIISIQVDGKDVEEVTEGEVGIKLDCSIKKGSELFIAQSN